jgi:hypothetical protein
MLARSYRQLFVFTGASLHIGTPRYEGSIRINNLDSSVIRVGTLAAPI